MGEFIHLRKGDQTQRIVAGAVGERVAAKWEADGWKRYEPEAPYDAAAAAKAARKEVPAKGDGDAAPPKGKKD